MEQAGLRERPLLLSARGTYPNLLAFLRRMELLEVLVEQKDLTLTVVPPEKVGGATPDGLPLRTPKVEVKLALTLWSKKPREAAGPPGQAPAALPGQAPAAPPGQAAAPPPGQAPAPASPAQAAPAAAPPRPPG